MLTPIAKSAAQLRSIRSQGDPVAEASREVLPYTRRIGDALGALRAIVTDNTPTAQLDSDLQVVHGIVAALVGPANADELVQKLPPIRECIATDVESVQLADPLQRRGRVEDHRAARGPWAPTQAGEHGEGRGAVDDVASTQRLPVHAKGFDR